MGDPQLFVIRVWRHASGFRASVRGVGDAEPLLFTAAERLTEFLCGAPADPIEDAAPARTQEP